MIVGDLPPLMGKLKGLKDVVTEQEIAGILAESYAETSHELDFESFLQVRLTSLPLFM